jgi:hypothetical protein
MKTNRSIIVRADVLIPLISSLTILSSRLQADTGDCEGISVTLPFTDVMGNGVFCQIAGAYFSGLTNDTSATTFNPTEKVTREQIAAFVSCTLDQSAKRSPTRAALGQWWTNQLTGAMTSTPTGFHSPLVVLLSLGNFAYITYKERGKNEKKYFTSINSFAQFVVACVELQSPCRCPEA